LTRQRTRQRTDDLHRARAVRDHRVQQARRDATHFRRQPVEHLQAERLRHGRTQIVMTLTVRRPHPQHRGIHLLARFLRHAVAGRERRLVVQDLEHVGVAEGVPGVEPLVEAHRMPGIPEHRRTDGKIAGLDDAHGAPPDLIRG